jgi:hypothetical protein
MLVFAPVRSSGAKSVSFTRARKASSTDERASGRRHSCCLTRDDDGRVTSAGGNEGDRLSAVVGEQRAETITTVHTRKKGDMILLASEKTLLLRLPWPKN